MIRCRLRTFATWCWTSLPLLAVLFLPTTAFAQTGTITGTVTNSVTGALIADVPIFIINSNNLSESGVVFQGTTNASGVYTFTGPAGGTTLRRSLRKRAWTSSIRSSGARWPQSIFPMPLKERWFP